MQENSFSLRPTGPIGTDSGLPSKSTLQAIFFAVLVIAIGIAAFVWSNGKVESAATTKKNAEAAKQQVTQQSQQLQADLTKLKGAGGTERLDTIRKIIDSGVSWPTVILSIGRSAPAGVFLGGFTGTGGGAATANTGAASPGASTPSDAGGTNIIALSGTAPNVNTVQQFIRSLRSKKTVIESVELNNASNTGGVTSFTLSVAVKAPAALPVAAAPAAAPTTAEGAAAQSAADSPQGGLLK